MQGIRLMKKFVVFISSIFFLLYTFFLKIYELCFFHKKMYGHWKKDLLYRRLERKKIFFCQKIIKFFQIRCICSYTHMILKKYIE